MLMSKKKIVIIFFYIIEIEIVIIKLCSSLSLIALQLLLLQILCEICMFEKAYNSQESVIISLPYKARRYLPLIKKTAIIGVVTPLKQ